MEVVPASMQRQTLIKLHAGCRLRSVWWPGISSQIERLVKTCSHCGTHFPWQKIGTDLFTLKGTIYIVARYPEVIKLTTTTSSSIISALKSTFGHTGRAPNIHHRNSVILRRSMASSTLPVALISHKATVMPSRQVHLVTADVSDNLVCHSGRLSIIIKMILLRWSVP